ncbi:MAG: purine-nucleoside phosphorylase [Clostridia bacterium]|nr:purine-nucleoside phosphorylase [Clostridia bacterium]
MNSLGYPTPHIQAEPSHIAKTVLMPGDPLRSALVAKEFLKDARLFNNVRGVQGYTGLWKNTEVSVMASGMGMPSIGIYSYELYHAYGVDTILRIGSAGALTDRVNLRDLVFGMGACTDSAYGRQFVAEGGFAPICDFDLLQTGVALAREKGLSYHVGNLLSTDIFYHNRSDSNAPWQSMGVLAVEMEAAALYMNAARAGKRALAICTVSDSLVTGEALPAEERQNSFTDMIELALDLAVQQSR